MPTLPAHLQTLSDEDFDRLETIISELESDWRSNSPREPADIHRYVPVGISPALKDALIIELSVTDLEFRVQQSDSFQVADYAAAFPELQEPDNRSMSVSIYDAYYELLKQYSPNPPSLQEFVLSAPLTLWKDLLPRIKAPSRFYYAPDSKAEVVSGMGRVIVAFNRELRCEVLLKELVNNHDAEAVAMFDREVAITAELNHPGVVAIHGTIDEEDRKAYAMRLLTEEGEDGKEKIAGTLLDAIGRLHEDTRVDFRGLEFKKLLQRLVFICRVVAYAHKKGIIHRDIKPQNIAVRPFDETILLDWGLAKHIGESDFNVAGHQYATRATAIKGTPAYMSPEQAHGESDQIDKQTDIFGLGATLYHLLTGRPPIEGKNHAECLLAARQGKYAKPRKIQRRIPRALQEVCLKAMADRQSRYEKVEDLADDLEGWLADQKVTAMRERPWEWSGRIFRRHSRVVLTSTVGLVALVFVMGIMGLQIRTQRDVAQRQAAELTFAQGLEWCENGRPRNGLLRMAEALAQLPANSGDLDHVIRMNLSAWSEQTPPLLAQARIEATDNSRLDGGPVLVDEGRRLMTWHADDTFREWDARTGEQLGSQAFGRPVGNVFPVANGMLAVVNALDEKPDAEARLWNMTQRQFVGGTMSHSSAGPDMPVLSSSSLNVTVPSLTAARIVSVAVTDDGQVAITGSQDGTARLWSVPKGEPIGPLVKFESPVTNVVFSHTNKFAAIGTENGRFEIRQVNNFEPAGGPHQMSGSVNAIQFSPDDQRLVTGDGQGNVLFITPKDGKTVSQTTVHGRVDQIAFSADGTSIFVRSEGTIRLFDSKSGRYLEREFRNQNGFSSAQFSPDGLLIATGSRDGNAQVWDVMTGEAYTSSFAHVRGVETLAFAEDGKWLVTSTRNGNVVDVWKWDLGVVRSKHLITLPHRLVLDSSFSPDGKQFAVVGEKQVFTGITDTGHLLDKPRSHGDLVYAVAFTPDGKSLLAGDAEVTQFAMNGIMAIGGRQNRVTRWNVEGNDDKSLYSMEQSDTIYEIGCDREKLYAATHDGTVVAWELSTGKLLGEVVKRLPERKPEVFRQNPLWGEVIPITNATTAIHANRGLCARAAMNEVSLFELASRSKITTFQEQDRVAALAFSGDGARLATASLWLTGGLVHIRDVGNTKAIRTLHSTPIDFPTEIESVAIGPDNRTLLVGGAQGRARLFDSITRHPIGNWLRHQDTVRSVSYHPRGEYLLTGTNSGAVQLWRAPRPMPGSPTEILMRVELWTGMRLNDQGIAEPLRDYRSADLRPSAVSKSDWHQRMAPEAQSGGYFKAARFHVSRLLEEKNTNSVEWLRARVALSERAQDYKSAVGDLARLIELLPEDQNLKEMHEVALWKSAAFREYLDKTHSTSGTHDALTLLRRSVALARIGQDTESDEHFQRALTLCTAMTMPSRVLWEQRPLTSRPESWRQFAIDCEAVLAGWEAPWQLWRCQGLAFAAAGQWQEAADTFRSVVEVQAERRDAWQCLAWCLRVLKNWPATIEAANQAIELEQDRTALLYLRGTSESMLKHWDAAATDLEEVVGKVPDCSDAWYLLGRVNLQRGRYSDAAKHFEQTIATGCDNPVVRDLAALAQAAAGNWPESLKHALTNVQDKNLNARLLQHFCIVCLGAKQPQGYSQVLNRLASMEIPNSDWEQANALAWLFALGPNSQENSQWAETKARYALGQLPAEVEPAAKSSVLNTLGAILVRAGKHEDAIAVLNEAVAADPSPENIIANAIFLASSYQELGNHEETRKWLEKLPDSDEIVPPASWEKLEQTVLIRQVRERSGKSKNSTP